MSLPVRKMLNLFLGVGEFGDQRIMKNISSASHTSILQMQSDMQACPHDLHMLFTHAMPLHHQKYYRYVITNHHQC